MAEFWISICVVDTVLSKLPYRRCNRSEPIKAKALKQMLMLLTNNKCTFGTFIIIIIRILQLEIQIELSVHYCRADPRSSCFARFEVFATVHAQINNFSPTQEMTLVVTRNKSINWSGLTVSCLLNFSYQARYDE